MQEVEGVEDTELTITLTGTDIDGDNLSFEVDTAPTQGTITENGTTFTYTPTQDFYGADSLTYRAYDGTEYSRSKERYHCSLTEALGTGRLFFVTQYQLAWY